MSNCEETHATKARESLVIATSNGAYSKADKNFEDFQEWRVKKLGERC